MDKFGSKLCLFVFSLLVTPCIPGVWAQTTTATILGTIMDDTRALVPGVTVTMTNLDKGLARTVLTNDLGHYRAANLPLGSYRVRAELPGFKTLSREGIELTVGREVVIDFVLEIGEITEQVMVTGEGSQLTNLTNATLEELVDENKLRALPLNGRDYVQLASLQPGVLIGGAQRPDRRPNTGTGVDFSISGGRPTQNNFRLDGISISDSANATPGATTGNNLGVEALQEFSVMTNTYSVEFGRSAGGVINVVTRSGTNQVHGSLYYFHRNDNLDARNFFCTPNSCPGDSPGSQKPPEFRRHQFGVAAGGPLVRDRTFIFANYEGLREVRPGITTEPVLTSQAREGNLSSGSVTVDPAVKPYLDIYPLPNLPNGEIEGDTGLFTGTADRDTNQNFFVVRGDHQLSETTSINASYTLDTAVISDLGSTFARDTTFPSRRQYLSLQLTQILGPQLIHSALFGFNRSTVILGTVEFRDERLLDPALGFIPGREAGRIRVPGIVEFPGGTRATDSDTFTLSSFQGYDNLSYDTGRHHLKFGFNLEVIRDEIDSTNRENGQFDFDSIEFFLTNRFSPGDVSFQSQLPGSDTVRDLRQQVWGFYVEDSLRVSPNLSLNLGLRYEFATSPTEADGKAAVLKNLSDSEVTIGNFFETPKMNLAPRLGFAWDVFGTGRTALRGGFGIFYDLPLVHFLFQPALRNPPFFKRETTDLSDGDFPTGAFDRLLEQGVADVEGLEPEPSSSYRMQYNLNIQHEILRNTLITVGYVGGRGVHLSRVSFDTNLHTPIVQDGRLFFPEGQSKPNSAFGQIPFSFFDASSFYNSFQLGVNRRFSEGLQIQGAYTVGKSIDDGSNTETTNQFINGVTNPFPLIRELGRGLSDYDIRQSVVINSTWDLPLRVRGSAEKLVNGWQLGGIFRGHSGIPFSARLAGDPANTGHSGRGSRSGQRPDQVGSTNNPIIGDPRQWFDSSAFAFPQAEGGGVLGNLGRNTLIGPGLASFDLILVKNTDLASISEDFNIQFRFEMFNAFNHANFGLPNNQVFFRELYT